MGKELANNKSQALQLYIQVLESLQQSCEAGASMLRPQG